MCAVCCVLSTPAGFRLVHIVGLLVQLVVQRLVGQ